MDAKYAQVFLSNFQHVPEVIILSGYRIDHEGGAETGGAAASTPDRSRGLGSPASAASAEFVASKSTPRKPHNGISLHTPDSPGLDTPLTEPTARRVRGDFVQVDLALATNLDKFFADEDRWKQVAGVMAERPKVLSTTEQWSQGGSYATGTFRIEVPRPYPGVQYRRSKHMEDKYGDFAKHGTTVEGKVEDDGNWLRLGDMVYLPMRVGGMQLVHPVDPYAVVEATSVRDQRQCCSCGQVRDPAASKGSKGKDPGARVRQQTTLKRDEANEGGPRRPSDFSAPPSARPNGADGQDGRSSSTVDTPANPD